MPAPAIAADDRALARVLAFARSRLDVAAAGVAVCVEVADLKEEMEAMRRQMAELSQRK